MPLIYQHQINGDSWAGVWHITETEAFFAARVPLQREITHWHKRLQHLAGRYLLTELVPGFPHELIRIADTRKPFLEDEAWHFSLSHCGDYAAALVSQTARAGVDIELISPKAARVQHKFLSAKEQDLLADTTRQYPGTAALELLTACWSIKEALFKWVGTGNIDFRTQLCIESIRLTAGGGEATCRLKKDGETPLRVPFIYIGSNCLSWVMAD